MEDAFYEREVNVGDGRGVFIYSSLADGVPTRES